VDVEINIFFIPALVGGEWSVSRPDRFKSGETASGIQWIGGWVGSRASLDDMEKKEFFTLAPLSSSP
jgi:hypothetical protein